MNGLREARLELWVEARAGRPAVNPVMAALLEALREQGALVQVRVPDVDAGGGAPTQDRADLILLKTMTTLGLAQAARRSAGGTAFCNPVAATTVAQDKAAVLGRLAAAGVPVPESYLHDPRGGSTAGTEAAGCWVSKPVLGWHGRGVRFHDGLGPAQAPDLAPLPADTLLDDGTRLVQRRVGGSTPDVKVYVAGEQVFARSKTFAPDSYASDQAAPVVLGRGELEVARAAGRVLGLRVFGVDLRSDQDALSVIDVNPFPGFRGCPESVPALVGEIRRLLEVSR